MSQPAPSSPPRRPDPGAIERLYVFWIVSSLLLLLVIVVVTLFVTGVLRRQSEDLVALGRRLTALEQTLTVSAAPEITADEPEVVYPPDDEAEAVSPAAEIPGAAAEPPERALDDAAVHALLDDVLQPGTDLPVVLRDVPAADAALQRVQEEAPQAEWAGETWARLALLARWLEQFDRAEMYARRAAASGVAPLAYYELATRLALIDSRPAEALTFAQRLAERTDDHTVVRLLRAQAYGMQENFAAADETLAGIETPESLSPHDRLRLGYMLIDLERWAMLGSVLDTLEALPEELVPERDYLGAVWLIQQNRLAEALAILDYLLELKPDDYDVRTWRGVALFQAGQYEAAREALAHAEQYPARPQAWYWLGMLQIERGDPEAAIPFLQRAFAASARYAPAWEALGTLALNRGDLPTALENFTTAVEINPRRASAHFLTAILHAKAARPDEAAHALRTTFALDPAFLETATQTEVLTRLFTPEVLESFLPLPPTTEPAAPDNEQPVESPE